MPRSRPSSPLPPVSPSEMGAMARAEAARGAAAHQLTAARWHDQDTLLRLGRTKMDHLEAAGAGVPDGGMLAMAQGMRLGRPGSRTASRSVSKNAAGSRLLVPPVAGATAGGGARRRSTSEPRGAPSSSPITRPPPASPSRSPHSPLDEDMQSLFAAARAEGRRMAPSHAASGIRSRSACTLVRVPAVAGRPG